MSSRPSRGAARLASILDALPDALLIVNANGTVVNANAIALETFETPGTALVGRGLLDLLPSFDPKRIPGSMRSPSEAQEDTRTKPTRMTARRTDGSEFPVQVTSANLEDGRTPFADHGNGLPHYTGDELLMLVVRDLSGTVDTEAELARQQRQTEMILRAAAEGVVGVDTTGRIVLVNPSAAQILGHRATDLGGKELHPLVHHSRPDGSPLAYEETPLADTLRSGRKHRVRGQVLWRKDGRPVPVDLTTAPVRDGDQLVGAVMTFTDRTQYDALAARAEQLQAVLDTSLRGPLAELRGELTGLAADPAGQLWPEANQILHHLAAGYARITTLIDNVLAFQRLDRGEDKLRREPVGLDDLVGAGVEGAVELIGPGRAQYAVHAPPVRVSVDGERMAQALAHLVADVAGVDAAGNAIPMSGDSTIVVAAAQRGDRVRIDVRGPSAGGDPVHVPLARGIVERHGGVLQTHEVPGQGSAYVLEVPAGTDGDAARGPAADVAAAAAPGATPASGTGSQAAQGTQGSQGAQGRTGDDAGQGGPAAARHRTGGAHGRRAHGAPQLPAAPAAAPGPAPAEPADPRAASGTPAGPAAPAGTDAAPGAQDAAPRPPRPRATDDDTGTIVAPVAPWAIPAAADQSEAPTGRRRALRRPIGRDEPSAAPQPAGPSETGAFGPAAQGVPGQGAQGDQPQPTGRRARRAAAEQPQDDEGRRELPAPPIPNALPPAAADASPTGPEALSQVGPQMPHVSHVPHQAQHHAEPAAPERPQPVPPGGMPATGQSEPAWPDPNRPALPAVPAWPSAPQPPQAQPASQPAEPSAAQDQATGPQQHGQNRTAISVRTLGQGVPYGVDPRTQPPTGPAGSGRRRRLAPQQSTGSILPQVPSQVHGPGGETQARQHPAADPDSGQLPVRTDGPAARPGPAAAPGNDPQTAPLRPVPPAPPARSEGGRSYAIGAPAEGADEGPEPLDGPNGAVDVTDVTDAADDRHEGPLEEPRRLLVWPEPDVSTRQALTDRGYRPVIVRSREEVDAQVAEPPAALFVDPLTGPITRTALQSLRQAAAAADVPVLVTAGLGQATREAAYGADPAVLLKALAPRDSEQHPPRVLLVESHEPIAQAFSATLERRGMQVTHADSEADAMTQAAQIHPNLVVMDLMLIRRRRQGIVDWLRGHSRLKRTPLVVYTSADIDPTELPRLASGETVLFLAERSTSGDVQARIVDLLGKIGA
ncbi:hybrid sensor histidine kinase/response regulator [Actinacidiphila acidipaludis]|uniref:PAS domain-containing protein n=1 Tax=Actinacidiphila acidipaludis TaxID=2873382 RepID=A0ABS7Q3A2_9ACTN|nr:PAS domain-containing protein [Streptomyces acidipaludis]MBY8877617.1 PAS domain-containing protein [Streptomyces acidipaludis]